MGAASSFGTIYDELGAFIELIKGDDLWPSDVAPKKLERPIFVYVDPTCLRPEFI